MPDTTTEGLLFSGCFGDDHRVRALDALEAIADGGARDILYIVASPAARRTVIAELIRRRRAIFGARVITLRSLPGELARRARTAEPRPLDRTIDELLVERELRVASGSRFADAMPVHGLVSTIARTIDLLDRNGATPEALAEFLQQEQHGDGARALARTWRSLSARRSHYGLTDAARLAWADGLLRERPTALAGLDVLVLEDLSLLTAVERSLVRSLLAAGPRRVIAAHGHAPQLPNAPSTRSLVRLRELAVWHEVRCASITGDDRFVARLFAPVDPARRSLPGSDGGDATSKLPRVTLLEAAGDLGEVRLAARVVRRQLDAGVAPEEIALVVHANARRYRELVREVFDGAGIPVAAALPRALADTGIGSVLLKLLELAIVPAEMTREASLAIARAPHLDLRTDEADRLERHVIRHGYLGLDGWDDLAAAALGDRATNRVNRLKRAVAGARAGFMAVATPRDAARIVRQLAKDLRLGGNAFFARRRAARGPGVDSVVETRSALALRADNQAWEALDAALDETVPAMLEVAPGAAAHAGLPFAERWLTMFARALRSSTVTPERAPAHAVQFRHTGPGGDAPAKVTIVLGLVEKIFPRQARQDPFLGDDLRSAARSRFGWELATTAESMDRERESFLRAVSSATDALYLSYPATDSDGRPAVRSFFIDDLRAAIGDEHPIAVEHSGSTTAIARVSDAVSASELLAALSHDVWQDLPRGDDARRRRAAALRVLAALGSDDTDLAVVRHGRRVSQRPELAGVLPETAPHHTLELSASQLKSMSHCTYRHFVDKVLTPQAIVPPEYNALEKGSLIHQAVMAWSTTIGGWERGEAALAELDAWMKTQIDAWSPAKRGSERTARATESDREQLYRLLRRELEELRRPGVGRPVYAELAFGEQPGERGPRHEASRTEPFAMEVPTAKGSVIVKFRGSMDRVDVVTLGGREYGVVIDYKTGRTSSWYAKDMMKGADLQLRLYLLVLEHFWGITPVGALYLGFGDGVRRGAIRADFVNHIAGVNQAAVEQKAVRLLEPGDWSTFVNETRSLIAPLVDRLVRLDITPAPRDHDCGFCEFSPICRYERWMAPA